MFYPAGSLYALAEESYRLGLYGLCNTPPSAATSTGATTAATGMASCPPSTRRCSTPTAGDRLDHDGPGDRLPVRPAGSLAELLGDRRPSRSTRSRPSWATGSASSPPGSWARPDELGRGIEHLGPARLPRHRRPLPNLRRRHRAHRVRAPVVPAARADGVRDPVVAFDNPAGDWIIHHEHNALRCPRTVDGLADALGADRVGRRVAPAAGGPRHSPTSHARHADWEAAFGGIYRFLGDPVGARHVKQYPREFGIDGSHGHCHRLLARSGLTEGLVLDLGCSSGPLAEPVSDLGFEYVGVDIDGRLGRGGDGPRLRSPRDGSRGRRGRARAGAGRGRRRPPAGRGAAPRRHRAPGRPRAAAAGRGAARRRPRRGPHDRAASRT